MEGLFGRGRARSQSTKGAPREAQGDPQPPPLMERIRAQQERARQQAKQAASGPRGGEGTAGLMERIREQRAKAQAAAAAAPAGPARDPPPPGRELRAPPRARVRPLSAEDLEKGRALADQILGARPAAPPGAAAGAPARGPAAAAAPSPSPNVWDLVRDKLRESRLQRVGTLGGRAAQDESRDRTMKLHNLGGGGDRRGKQRRPARGEGGRGRGGGPGAPAGAGAPPPGPAGGAPRTVQLRAGMTGRELAGALGLAFGELEALARAAGDPLPSQEDAVPLELQELACLEHDAEALPAAAPAAERAPRTPVVAVMGHVDHGKTSLLDALRRTDVAAGEAGGITQHVGAFSVALPGSRRRITFLDTPGHEAFGSLRRRGAAVTDVVVLAVACDDGVMPQTRESLRLAREAGCPVVVALTKSDRDGADPDAVLAQLAAEGLVAEALGGDVLAVRTAAPSGGGVAELEEAVLLQADLMGLAARRDGPAEGTVVDARLDRGKGPVAVVVVREGTLRVGDPLLAGTTSGRARHLFLPGRDERVDEAPPGSPVEVAGLDALPAAGDALLVASSEERARRVAQARASRRERERARAAASPPDPGPPGAAPPAAGPAAGPPGAPAVQLPVSLPVVVKADVQGSLEAVRELLDGMSTDVVSLRVLDASVGGLSRRDLAPLLLQSREEGGGALRGAGAVVAFNARVDRDAAAVLDHDLGWEVVSDRVIYRIADKVGELMARRAPLVSVTDVSGTAEVLQTFPAGRAGGAVAGCQVRRGFLAGPGGGCLRYRVVRAGEVVWEGPARGLRRFRDEVDTVPQGHDCGVLLDGFDAFEAGDVLECVARMERRMDVNVPAAQQLGVAGGGPGGR